MAKLLQPLLKHLPSQASQQAQTLIQSPPVPLHALHLHERRLLGPLVQLLRHKDDAVRHQSLYVLLECVRSSPLGMAELVDTPNCMQALVHVLTAGVQGPASAQAIAVTAAHVLWNLSSDVGVRALMHEHTPSLGKVFFGLLDHASVHMRAAGSGALYNLASSIGQVARELPCNTQLVAFLVSMLGKDKDWRQVPHAGQQPAEWQQQQDLLQGRLGRLYIDANLGGGGPQQDMAFEAEVLVEAHAAGLLSILVQSNAQAQLLLSLEGGIEQVLLGLQVTASSPVLQHASAQLRDTCGRVLMGLLCHASTRISTTTSHMLLTHAVCLESEAAQLVCGNASVRRGMADALAAAALALGVPKQEVASSLSSLPQGAPDPPLIRASFEVGADGEAAVSGVSTAEGKAAALQQLQARGGKEEGGSELRRSKRWQALEAKAQGSDPLERLQAGQDVMYMLHVLVADEECARAFAVADYGIVHMLRLMAFLDVNAALRSTTPAPALSTTSDKSSASAVALASGAPRPGTELGMAQGANAGSQQAMQKLAASTEALRDDQVLTGLQALAAGTLAHLAGFEAIRQLPAMQQALSPEPYQLTALAVLMLPQPEPSKSMPSTASSHPNGQHSAAGTQLRDNRNNSGAATAEGSTSSEKKPALQPNPMCVQGVHLQGMLAMLLAAVAQHGPFAYATFTSVLLQAPGSLGIILSLLPSPKDRVAATQAQAKWPPSAPLSTRTRPFSSGSAAGSSMEAGLGPKLQGKGTNEGLAKPSAGAEERDRASAIKRNGVPDLWVSDYPLALSLLACPRLDMGRPWLVAKPASMMAALKLCCVAAAGSRDVAWVLASKTPLVPSTLTLLMGKSQVMDLWHYSGLSPADWQYSLQHWGLGVLKALVTSLDDAQAYDQIAMKADLVPTLLHSLHSPSPVVCVDALELLEALLGHILCSQVLENSNHASKLVVQLMLMAGLLEPSNSSNSLGSALHSSNTPIRLQAACLANRRKANSPNKGNKQSARAQASVAQQQEQACVASAAASVLHLLAASAEPPYNVTLGHLAGVPHAMEALVEQIGLLAMKLATPSVRALEHEVDQLRHLTGLAAEACLKGVMPPLLPHPPPCPLLDISQHTARLQTSSGRSPNHDGQLPTRTGTSSARHGSSHSKVGSVLPGPAGDALRSLAHVRSALEVVSECAGALLHALNHDGVVELMPQVYSAGDERSSNQHGLWPEILSARAGGTGHTPGHSRMPSGLPAMQIQEHMSVNGPSPLGLQPYNAGMDMSAFPTHYRPPRAALESICHDSLVILHRLLIFWSLEAPAVLASHLEGVHRCLYQGGPLQDDSPGPYKDTGQHGSQGGINGVGCPLPPPFGSNPTHRLALIAEICGEGLVRTSSVAVQRAAAHCLNATVALHPDLAKFILATLPKVRSNALDVMMAAVVRMGGGDSGASQEHRVELALAALAAASGSSNLKRIAGAPSRSLFLPSSQQRQRQHHNSGTCSGALKPPGGTDGAQLKGNKALGGADAEDTENPLLDDLMSYAEVMVASFDAVRRLLLAAPKDKAGLLRPVLATKDTSDLPQQYYQFSRQGVSGGGVGSRATPQQGIQKRRYVREVLANNSKPYSPSIDAAADPRTSHSLSYAGVPPSHLHAWREDWSLGLQDQLGGASDAGIGEQQVAKALDLMLEEDTLSQLQAMLEAVWAQQREAWALCVGQVRRALDQRNLQLIPPVETRRLPQGDSFKGKAQSGNLKQQPGTSVASQATTQQQNHGGFYKCNSWDGFRLEAEDGAGWARISDALQRVAAASAAAAANVPPDLRLVAAEVVVAVGPLAQKPLIGKAGGLLRGLGSVLAEPFSGASAGTGTASIPNPPVNLAATHMTGEGSSGRSVGDALMLRLQERQQKLLVLQALWSLSRTPGGPQAISISGAAAASAMPGGARSRRSSPANHMATNNARSTAHGHGNASSNSSGSPGSGSAKASMGVPVLPGLVSLIVQVQDHGLKAHAAGVVAAVSCHLDPSLLSTIGGTAGLAAGLVAVVTNLVPVLTKALFTANGVRTPSPSSYAGPTHSPPPLPRTASPGMGSAYGPEGPDFNTIEAQAMACITALAALAELCRSAPVAARVATLKGLPAALAAALRMHSMDICLYAAGLAGNLLSHTASQSATITAARGTLSKDLVKCLKVLCTAPHPSSSTPSSSPAAHFQQSATAGPSAAGQSVPGYPATAPGGGGAGSSTLQGMHAAVLQPASDPSQEPVGSPPGALEPVGKQEALMLLLGALRNLASCDQGRAEMANDSATVPLLLCILRQEPWQIARPNQSKARTLKEQRRYDVNMGPVMEPYRPQVPSDSAAGEHAGTAARGRAGEGEAPAPGPHGAHGNPTSSPPRALRTLGIHGQGPGGHAAEAGASRAGTGAEAGEGGGMQSGQQHSGSRGSEHQLQEPMYRPHIQVLAASVLANLSVDRGSQEAFVTDADLVIRALLDVLSCAVTLPAPSHPSPGPSTSPFSSQASNVRQPSKMSPMSALQESMSKGSPALHDREKIAYSRAPSDSFTRRAPGLVTSASGSLAISASSVQSSAVHLSMDSTEEGQLSGSRLRQGAGAESPAHSSMPALGPFDSGSGYTAVAGHPNANEAAAGGGTSVIPIPENPAVASQLQCYVAVALSNAMSHAVLARAALVHVRTVPLLCALIMRIPCPGDILEAASTSPQSLHSQRQTLEGWGRLISVAALRALQQLLSSVGPRAVQQLREPKPGEALPVSMRSHSKRSGCLCNHIAFGGSTKACAAVEQLLGLKAFWFRNLVASSSQ
uniref:Uncharacterized protein n=1 Tax=Dunaliella tertiolecta TaxID=3047 RepID=A0A7S3QQG6_DUNTE